MKLSFFFNGARGGRLRALPRRGGALTPRARWPPALQAPGQPERSRRLPMYRAAPSCSCARAGRWRYRRRVNPSAPVVCLGAAPRRPAQQCARAGRWRCRHRVDPNAPGVCLCGRWHDEQGGGVASRRGEANALSAGSGARCTH